jgi:response regulator RpfG family c-di-GMP phosphodiesterase
VSAVLRSVGEHWDGNGHPGDLAGAQIPIAARIIAVATALVAGRYAIEPIQALAGTRFDPTVVGAAEELVKQR